MIGCFWFIVYSNKREKSASLLIFFVQSVHVFLGLILIILFEEKTVNCLGGHRECDDQTAILLSFLTLIQRFICAANSIHLNCLSFLVIIVCASFLFQSWSSPSFTFQPSSPSNDSQFWRRWEKYGWKSDRKAMDKKWSVRNRLDVWLKWIQF